MAGKRGEGKTTTMTGADWQRILRLMDEAFGDYESALVALRKRVVDDMRRKLNDGGGSDHARRGARSRLARKRGRKRR